MGKRFWGTLPLALAITCSVARAEVGLSYLAMCQKDWPCSLSLSAYKNASVIRTGWLEHTFGEECPCVDRLLADKRPKEVRIHLANGPCLRNKRCGKYEIFHGYSVASANRAIKRKDDRLLNRFRRVAERAASRLAQGRAPLTCYVSPVLESDFDEQARSVLHSLTATYFPSCRIVDNPLRGRCIKGTICERHGPNPGLARPCIADLDGSVANRDGTYEFLKRTKHCRMSLVWTPEMNCNSHLSQPFIDPRKRNCERSRGYYMELAGWIE